MTTPDPELVERAREMLASIIDQQFGDGVTARAVKGRVPYTMINADMAVSAIVAALQSDRSAVLEEAAKVVDNHRPDASFDDSGAGAMERNALLDNVASEIRALKAPSHE